MQSLIPLNICLDYSLSLDALPASHEVLCPGYLVCHSSPRNGWIDYHALSIARSMQSLAMQWPSLIQALFRINLAQILLNLLEMCHSLSLYQIYGQLTSPTPHPQVFLTDQRQVSLAQSLLAGLFLCSIGRAPFSLPSSCLYCSVGPFNNFIFSFSLC